MADIDQLNPLSKILGSQFNTSDDLSTAMSPILKQLGLFQSDRVLDSLSSISEQVLASRSSLETTIMGLSAATNPMNPMTESLAQIAQAVSPALVDTHKLASRSSLETTIMGLSAVTNPVNPMTESFAQIAQAVSPALVDTHKLASLALPSWSKPFPSLDALADAIGNGLLDRHIWGMSEVAVLGHACLTQTEWSLLGERLAVNANQRRILQSTTTHVASSYQALLDSLASSEASVLSLPPIYSEISSNAFFTSMKLIHATSPATVEYIDEDFAETSNAAVEELGHECQQELHDLLRALDPSLRIAWQTARADIHHSDPARRQKAIGSLGNLCDRVLSILVPASKVSEVIGKLGLGEDQPRRYISTHGHPTREGRIYTLQDSISSRPFANNIIRWSRFQWKTTKLFKAASTEHQIDEEMGEILLLQAELWIRAMIKISETERKGGGMLA